MTYSVAGAVLALAGLAIALRARGTSNYFAADVYRMTPRSHAVAAAVSGAFATLFAANGLLRGGLAVPALAVYLLIFILYAASFVRGASGEDE